MIPVNKNIVKDEIQWLLEAIEEQFDAIKSYEGRIPQIEFDIIMENVRKVYEKLHMLQRSDDPYAYFEEKMRDTPVIKPMVPVMEAKDPITEAEQDQPEPGIKIRIHSSNEEDQEAETTLLEEQPVIESIIADPSSEVDLFTGSGNGFSEKLKEARERGIGAKLSREKSGDLKSSITINEKFLMINELFEGNLRDYNETIETFNGFHDLRTAMEFLDLLRKKNLWDSGSKVFLRLKELLETRFN
ncbi:MAG: hypothetical protein NTX61_02640 [Bacteroidetes bacterium]|nr:hypothetical protein [Bacteroidota bacterium]